MRARVTAARAANRPNLSLRAQLGFTGPLQPYDRRNYDRSVVGQVVLTQPLLTGGVNNSLIRQALDQNSVNRVGIESARRVVVQNVANAWNQMLTARANVRLQQAQVKAAAVAFRGMQVEYPVGLRSTLDVLVAEETLRDAELAVIAARHDEYVASAALLRATGRLEARDLVIGLRQYDPSRDLRRVEHRGSVPWEGLVARIDSIGSPGAGQRRLDAPPAPQRPLTIAPAGPAVPTEARLATFSRQTPVPGTVSGRP